MIADVTVVSALDRLEPAAVSAERARASAEAASLIALLDSSIDVVPAEQVRFERATEVQIGIDLAAAVAERSPHAVAALAEAAAASGDAALSVARAAVDAEFTRQGEAQRSFAWASSGIVAMFTTIASPTVAISEQDPFSLIYRWIEGAAPHMSSAVAAAKFGSAAAAAAIIPPLMIGAAFAWFSRETAGLSRVCDDASKVGSRGQRLRRSGVQNVFFFQTVGSRAALARGEFARPRE